MQKTQSIPKGIKDVVGEERIEFAERGRRRMLASDALLQTAGGVMGIVLGIVLSYKFFYGVFESNPYSSGSMFYYQLGLGFILASVVMGFAYVGAEVIIRVVKKFVVWGDWYVGTPSRLFIYSDNELATIKWKEFRPDVKIEKKAKRGIITLHHIKGNVYKKLFTHSVRPSITRMLFIKNFNSVGKICRDNIIRKSRTSRNQK